MAFSKFFFVAVVALLSCSVSSYAKEDSVAVARSDGVGASTGLTLGGSSSRDLLGKKKNKRKNKRRNKSARVARANSNGKGVTHNQDNYIISEGGQSTIDLRGTDVITNVFNRKLASVEGGEGLEDAIAGRGFPARDLLKKKKKRKSKKTTKKNIKKAESIAVNQNGEGFLANQQGSVLIEGDGNGVLVGEIAPVFNANLDVGDITGRRLSSRDLLRKKKRKNKKSKKNVKKSESIASNQNGSGVLINQQTTANIDGDGNVVVGGQTAEVDNRNINVGDCEGPDCDDFLAFLLG